MTLTLPLQATDILLDIQNELLRPIHRSLEVTAFALPPVHALDLGVTPAILDFDLLAEAALRFLKHGLVDQFHAARFTSAVLVIAPVREPAPAPASAVELFLVVEAHVYQTSQRRPASDLSNLLIDVAGLSFQLFFVVLLVRSGCPTTRKLPTTRQVVDRLKGHNTGWEVYIASRSKQSVEAKLGDLWSIAERVGMKL